MMINLHIFQVILSNSQMENFIKLINYDLSLQVILQQQLLVYGLMDTIVLMI